MSISRHSRAPVGLEMSSSTSRVVIIPRISPIGPSIIHVIRTGAEICIGFSPCNILIQIYLPAKVSITKKCNHASIIISSVENRSITILGVGVSTPKVNRTLPTFGISKVAYDITNGNRQIRKLPTIFFVNSCVGINHIRNQRGNM